MTSSQAMLDATRLASFEQELDALRERTLKDLGERDARYIRGIVSLQRRAELLGRVLLHTGIVPPVWGAGVALLSLAKILDNMEIGHNVLHAQYDWMNDPTLNSTTYDWDIVCPPALWKHSHNYQHHTFTNILGKDRDVGYGLLRVTSEQPWTPDYLPQAVYALALMPVFQWGIAIQAVELEKLAGGKGQRRATLKRAELFLRKAGRQVIKDYVAFPLIAGPLAPSVLAGNLVANVVRNSWAFLVIFCGHFPEGVTVRQPKEEESESRGEWYLRQVTGSANFTGPRWLHVLAGHLSRQIEHHLFPDLPAGRYDELAAEVEGVCRKYGVPYNSNTFLHQIGTVAWKILRYSFPGARALRPGIEP